MNNELPNGTIVFFHEKVYTGPYAPYYDAYKDQLFEVIACHYGDHFELQCISDFSVHVDGFVHGDELIPANSRIADFVASTDLRYNEHQPAKWKREELARFAEKIIRECALIVHKQTGPRSALNILEHYGLKEE